MKRLLKRVFFYVFPQDLFCSLCFEFKSKVSRTFAKDLNVGLNKKNIINLGCGNVYIPGVINIDFFGNKKSDYQMDIRYPFRISDGTIDGVFSEHTLEHLSHQEVSRALSECYRILKPGGRIRVIVPDLSIFIRNYYEDNEEWFYKWRGLVLDVDSRRHLLPYFNHMFAINFTANFYSHKTCWDRQVAKQFLENAGFVDVEFLAFNKGDKELCFDRDAEDRKLVSLYVEAVKGKLV